jgi:hypothetical protein
MNPIQSLFKSRKFLLLLLDTFVALILYFLGRYAPLAWLEDTEFVILAVQPIFIALILSIAWEDAAAKRAGTFEFYRGGAAEADEAD